MLRGQIKFDMGKILTVYNILIYYYNITQQASGRQINSSKRINVILESCVINDITFAR